MSTPSSITNRNTRTPCKPDGERLGYVELIGIGQSTPLPRRISESTQR